MDISKIKAIIFDMDGVIVDSEPVHIKAERAICGRYGIKAPFSEWDQFRGWTSVDIFSYLVKNYGDKKLDPRELADQKSAYYLKISKNLKLIPGFLVFIKKCRKNFSAVGLATSSKKIIQESIFKRFSLGKYFDFIVAAEDIKRGKPHPEVFRKAVRTTKFKPQQCLVIEDASNGVVAAKKAGCSVLGITTSENRVKLLRAGADQVIDKYKDIEI